MILPGSSVRRMSQLFFPLGFKRENLFPSFRENPSNKFNQNVQIFKLSPIWLYENFLKSNVVNIPEV
jgi:hypothetical protein